MASFGHWEYRDYRHTHKHTQTHAGFARGQCLLKPLCSRWSKEGIIRTKDWLLQGIQRGADSCLSQWFLCSRLLLKLSFSRLLSAVFSSVIAGTVASFYGLSPCLPSITGVANINATGCSSSLKTRWNVSTRDLHEKDQFLFRLITVQAHWGRGGEGSIKRRAFVMAVCTLSAIFSSSPFWLSSPFYCKPLYVNRHRKNIRTL